MTRDRATNFGRYRLDRDGLWRGKQEVRLTPKALAVLSFLVERSGQVVTKQELFQSVWPDTVVSDSALTSCIQELRQALRDDARRPRYLETLHRRGYRFTAVPAKDAVPPLSPPVRHVLARSCVCRVCGCVVLIASELPDHTGRP